MLKVGFVGWRGMVGSVLLSRMVEEKDFQGFEALFFSTSQAGEKAPAVTQSDSLLKDAFNLNELGAMDIIVTCQGGDYTNEIYPRLRKQNWSGYWIDASSALRMEQASIISLDPVNRAVIDDSLKKGLKDYIGGNCTVSLMLMAISGLFHEGCIEWLTSMTYQAASGAGAKNMRELIAQMKLIGDNAALLLDDPAASIQTIDQNVIETIRSSNFPIDHFGAPLAASLIPWIDRQVEEGQTREEWKGMAETNKILGLAESIPVDGLCVRIGAMRSHCQALTIKLTRDIPLKEIEELIASSNAWVKIVANQKEETLKELTPARVSGTLSIPVGRIRKMNLGPQYVTCFTVGDQLLWGAAEPLRRILKIILEFLNS